MEQLEIILNTSTHQLHGWIRDYQTFKHKLLHSQLGSVCYDEDDSYFLYYAPCGSFKIYWQQLSRKTLKVYIKLTENCTDFPTTLAYAKELLMEAIEDFGRGSDISDPEYITDEAYIQSLHRQLKIYRGNLNDLLEQAAKHGTIDVPTKLRNEIKETKEKIAEMEKEIEEVDARIKALREGQHKSKEKKPHLGIVAQGKAKGWIS